jgi:hypothetical protein
METWERFAQAYATAVGGLQNLALDRGEIRQRIEELAAIAGPDGTLEDYTGEVLSNGGVRAPLVRIDASLGSLDDGDRRRLVSLVNDLLLAGSLVPARETASRDRSTLGITKVYHRQAIEIMPIALLTSTLEALAQLLADAENPLDDAGIRPLRYNENDPLAQRLTSISLLNLKPETRTALADSPTYQAMLDSDSLEDFLYASNGHDEQQFLTTCIVSAVGTDLKGKTPTLLGLVQIGRGVAKRVEDNLRALEASNPAVLDETERSDLFGGARTLRELVEGRLAEAASEFDDIERQLAALASYTTGRSGAMPTDVLDQLTDRWSRVMQKLSAVINVTEGVEGTAVWSKKRIAGTWMPSAVLAAPTMVDRPARRLGGIKDEFLQTVGAQIESFADFETDNLIRISELVDDPGAGQGWIPAFWRVAQERGGVPTETRTSVSEHHCFLKAVRRGDDQVFALSDPKVAGLVYLDEAELASWARSTGSQIPVSIATQAAVLAGKLKRGEASTEVTPISTEEAAEPVEGDYSEDGSGDGSEDGGEPEPQSSSDPWALARWELAGTDTPTLVHERNHVALHELADHSWAPYWIADVSSVSVTARSVLLVGYGHHVWFYDHLVDVNAPTGYILKQPGRLGRHTWQASGAGEHFTQLRDTVRACGFKGNVTAYGGADRTAAEIGFENHRALKDLDRGDTIRYWITADSLVLIGDGHLSERYDDPAGEGTIRKGRHHYYVDGDSGDLDLVRGAIEATGSERTVVAES